MAWNHQKTKKRVTSYIRSATYFPLRQRPKNEPNFSGIENHNLFNTCHLKVILVPFERGPGWFGPKRVRPIGPNQCGLAYLDRIIRICIVSRRATWAKSSVITCGWLFYAAFIFIMLLLVDVAEWFCASLILLRDYYWTLLNVCARR